LGTLPIGLNRISWKLDYVSNQDSLNHKGPTDWVKSD